MSNKKKSLEVLTDHHITPRSRGGRGSKRNIARVPDDLHKHYHALFDNQTPPEIIKTLVNDYWNGQWKYVDQLYDGRPNGR